MKSVRSWAFWTLIFGIAAVVLIIWQVGFQDILSLLGRASVIFIILYLVTSLLIAMVHTYKWQLILHSLGYHVAYNRLFVYRLVGYSVSYLTPTTHVGSEPIRALLLKKEGIPTNESFSNVIIDKSIELITHALFFFIGALVILNSVEVAGNMKIFILSFSLILMLIMGLFIAGILGERSMFLSIFRFFRLNRIRKLQAIEKNLIQIEKQIEYFYTKKKEYFLAIIAIIVVLWILMFFEYRFALLILGHKASITEIFLILTGVGIAYSIPIPVAMGALELGQISATKVLQLGSVTGVALAFIIRGRDLVWTVIGLIYLAYYHFSFPHLAKETKRMDKELKKGKIFKE